MAECVFDEIQINRKNTDYLD